MILAQVNRANLAGHTPLMEAALSDNTELVGILIGARAEVI